MSVQIYSGSDFYLDLEKGSTPVRNDSPGEVAADVTSEMVSDCGSLMSGDNPGLGAILAPFCVLGGVAVGATAGAITSATDGDPEKEEANIHSAIEAANTDDTADTWQAMLQSSLEQAGRQKGKNIVRFPEGEPVYLIVKDLHWAKEGREHWAIAGKFRIATRYGEKFATKNFDVSGVSHGIEDWLANDGALVFNEIQLLFEQVANRVWTIITR